MLSDVTTGLAAVAVRPADQLVHDVDRSRGIGEPFTGAQRVRQAAEIEKHRDLAAGLPGNAQGLADELVANAGPVTVGRVGHDMGARWCPALMPDAHDVRGQKVDPADAVATINQIGRVNRVPVSG